MRPPGGTEAEENAVGATAFIVTADPRPIVRGDALEIIQSERGVATADVDTADDPLAVYDGVGGGAGVLKAEGGADGVTEEVVDSIDAEIFVEFFDEGVDRRRGGADIRVEAAAGEGVFRAITGVGGGVDAEGTEFDNFRSAGRRRGRGEGAVEGWVAAGRRQWSLGGASNMRRKRVPAQSVHRG
jgi:hypothetical protein